VVGGLAYQVADGVVGEQERPDFLFHHLGGFGPQDAGGSSLVDFQLVEAALEFPPLLVGGGELDGSDFFRVGEGGDQAVDLVLTVAVRDLVFLDR
jgi:hypothetical protein